MNKNFLFLLSTLLSFTATGQTSRQFFFSAIGFTGNPESITKLTLKQPY